MRRLYPALLAALLLTAVGDARAQTLPVQLDVDVATFAYAADSTLLELYLAFDASTLDYRADADGDYFTTRVPVQLDVSRNTDAALQGTPTEPVWADSMLLQFALRDTTGLAPGQHFVHQMRTAVPAGEYQLRVTLPQTDARQEVELRRDLLVPSYDLNAVALSDLELASSIVSGGGPGEPFYKNQLTVRPNATALYGQGLEQVFYYAEAYGTDQLAGANGEYTLFAYVAEANQPQPLDSLRQRQQRTAQPVDVLVGAFDISDLPSGTYFLRLALLNEQNAAVAEQARKFFVYNPGVQRETVTAPALAFESSPYAVMSEEDVDERLGQVRILMTGDEERRYRTVRDSDDLDLRRRFLMDFWQARDPRPRTPQNEYRDEFLALVTYVNDRYSSSFREGWESDRGRTVLKYGRPAQIDPRLYESEMLPHEVWMYENIPGEGSATFVFADRDGFGDFELIHSTVAGERSLPNWQAELVR